MNGSPAAKFVPEKGLRQGDPLSPFLLNVVDEGLNVLLQRALSSGLIKGVVIGHGDSISTISHLQFADDTIIFCEVVWEEVLTIKRILRCFQLVSSLKINFSKSLMSGIVCLISWLRSLLTDFIAKANACPFHTLVCLWVPIQD